MNEEEISKWNEKKMIIEMKENNNEAKIVK